MKPIKKYKFLGIDGDGGRNTDSHQHILQPQIELAIKDGRMPKLLTSGI